MAQEIMVAGAIYEDVPSVRLPDSNGVFHPFTDTSDTTAVAADVAQGKTFHLADGSAATGTAAGATLVTKSITANGTYSAEDDDADGYSEVTVNVSGGDEKAVIVSPGTIQTTSSTYKILYRFTINKTGTYKVSWMAIRYATSGSGYGTQLRVNSTIIDTYTTFNFVRNGQHVAVTQALNEGDRVEIYACGNGTYNVGIGNVIIQEQ